MELTELMLALSYLGAGLGVAGCAHSIWEFFYELRADRHMAQVLAERSEYAPLLRAMMERARHHGGAVRFSEHEAIDLRESVRRALVHLEPRDRKHIEASLYGRTVSGREAYLRRLLAASMKRLQHQS